MDVVWRQTRAAWIAARPTHADQRGVPLTEAVEPAIVALCARLLELDGIRVCIPFIESADLCQYFVTSGALVTAQRAHLKLGRAHDCHGNSARRWQQHPHHYHIVTGYALSEDDGMWRRHSWNIDANSDIIETTEERSQYFGVVLTLEQAQGFADMYAAE